MRYESPEEQKRASEIYHNAMRMGLMRGEEPMRAMARELAQLEGWRDVNTKRLQEHHDLRAENDRLLALLKLERDGNKKQVKELEQWSSHDISNMRKAVAEIKDLGDMVDALEATLTKTVRKHNAEIEDRNSRLTVLRKERTATAHKLRAKEQQLKERTSDLDAVNAARSRAVAQRDDARALVQVYKDLRGTPGDSVIHVEVRKRERNEGDAVTIIRRISYAQNWQVALLDELERLDARNRGEAV